MGSGSHSPRISRLQRYDGAGQFERGWFAKTAGGLASVGLTSDNKIAVAAARTRKVEFFNWDGSSAGPPQPFTRRGNRASSDYLSPSDYLVEGVTFERPVPGRQSGPPLECHPAVPTIAPLHRMDICGVWAPHRQLSKAEGILEDRLAPRERLGEVCVHSVASSSLWMVALARQALIILHVGSGP
jgi:hypothetical protein